MGGEKVGRLGKGVVVGFQLFMVSPETGVVAVFYGVVGVAVETGHCVSVR